MSMQQFAKLMGPPPKVRGTALASPPPKKAQMPAASVNLDVAGQEEGQQVDEEEALGRGDSLALAVLEQSRALTSLVTSL